MRQLVTPSTKDMVKAKTSRGNRENSEQGKDYFIRLNLKDTKIRVAAV